MITIGGRKLFEEIDRPTGMKITSKDSESVEIEAGWKNSKVLMDFQMR